jgi:hypothetical protein
VVVLRRQDGAFVAAFSAIGVTEEAIVEAAREDYRALLEEHASSLGLDESEDQDLKKDASTSRRTSENSYLLRLSEKSL